MIKLAKIYTAIITEKSVLIKKKTHDTLKTPFFTLSLSKMY